MQLELGTKNGHHFALFCTFVAGIFDPKAGFVIFVICGPGRGPISELDKKPN